jgi:hypothetical protein
MLKPRGSRCHFLLAAVVWVVPGCGDEADPAPGAQGPGPEGPPGPAGNPDDPSISAVTPSWSFLERTTTVSISGYNTDWADDVDVDFGAGVTVDEVSVISATGLLATVTTAIDAAPDPHDVTVTSGDVTLTAAGAFEPRPAAELLHLAGPGTQGSLNVYAFSVLDPSHEVMPGDPSGNFVSGAAGTSTADLLQLGDAGSGWAIVEVVLDATAPASAPLSLVSENPLGRTVSSAGYADVTPSPPTPLVIDTPLSQAYGSTPLATHVFRYTNDSGSDQLVDAIITGDSPIGMFYMPNNGHASDGHSLPVTGLRAGVRDGESIYLAALNPFEEIDFDFEITVENARPATFYTSQALDDQQCGRAQDTGFVLAGSPGSAEGFVIEGGALSFEDVDWYRLTVDNDGALQCLLSYSPGFLWGFIHEATDCAAFIGAGSNQLFSAPVTAGEDYFIRIEKFSSTEAHSPRSYSVHCLMSYAL